jgi:hypothetical protein
MNDQTNNQPEPHPFEDLASESGTTASESQSCERCELPLTGRKQRWCSDCCRMQDRGERRAGRLNETMAAIENALAALRFELEGDHAD